MTKTLRLVFLSLCVVGSPATAADLRLENPQRYAELRDATFNPLFQALLAGDVATIRHYLTGDTYKQYRVLMEQNQQYGQFLRSYYAGSNFELGEVTPVGDDYVARVFIHWPTGNTSVVDLQVHSTPVSIHGSGILEMPTSGGDQARWTVGAPVESSRGKRKQ